MGGADDENRATAWFHAPVGTWLTDARAEAIFGVQKTVAGIWIRFGIAARESV